MNKVAHYLTEKVSFAAACDALFERLEPQAAAAISPRLKGEMNGKKIR
jgi:hypothetical protein